MNDLQLRKLRVKHNGYSFVKYQNRPTAKVVEPQDDALFVEIFEELKTINRKKTLKRFIGMNRDIIKTLNENQKGLIFNYISNKFN